MEKILEELSEEIENLKANYDDWGFDLDDFIESQSKMNDSILEGFKAIDERLKRLEKLCNCEDR